MNNFVSRTCHFLFQYVYVSVILEERECVFVCRPQPYVVSCDFTELDRALTEEDPPPCRILSEYEGPTAGSTNPGAPNSAICPAMCSHTSWEHSASCLSNSLTGAAMPQTEKTICLELGVMKSCC